MTCDRLRDRLLAGETGAEIDRHLADCPECARFAARLQAARQVLARPAHPADLVPHPAFARRVVARLPGSTEMMGRLALRALPAALVLALALAWLGLDQAPLPAATLLVDEPTSEALLTWSALAPPGATGPGGGGAAVKRGVALTAIFALFLVGVLVGVLGTHAFYLHEMHQPGGLGAFGTRLLARDLKHRLDLDARQQAEVERALADANAEGADLRREMMPRLFTIFGRTHRRIEAVLTPEQRVEFERYRKKHLYRLHHLLFGG